MKGGFDTSYLALSSALENNRNQRGCGCYCKTKD